MDVLLPIARQQRARAMIERREGTFRLDVQPRHALWMFFLFAVAIGTAHAQAPAALISPIDALIKWAPFILWGPEGTLNGFTLNLIISFLAMALGTVAGAALGWGLCRLLQSIPGAEPEPELPEPVTQPQALPEPAPEPTPPAEALPAPIPAAPPAPPDGPCVGTIELPALPFALGQAIIRLESFDTLDRTLERLTLCPDEHVRVEGHSDSTGPEDLNLQLSRDRAAAVRTYLVEAGIDAARVTAAGLGGERPIATNDTRAGRVLNRRVEIHFIDVPQG